MSNNNTNNYVAAKIEPKWSLADARDKREYNPSQIENKWQKAWRKKSIYKVDLGNSKNKFYLLVEFTYPSGDLHMGHWFAFAVPDILARFKRMTGYSVFAPNGFDAFGLPAENAAITRGVHPKDWTYSNIKLMRKQFAAMGAVYDWDHQVITCDPDYFRWNQWIFLKMYERGLAYRGKALSNWCPRDNCVLANENVEAGKCWRCGTEVVQKEVDQWFLKITEYAEKLLWKEKLEVGREKLDNEAGSGKKSNLSHQSEVESDSTEANLDSYVSHPTSNVDWPQSIREGQNNWIGKSEGAIIKFEIRISTRNSLNASNSKSETNSKSQIKKEIEVFTTRPDTLFGATFMVLAPEHDLVAKLLNGKWQMANGKLREIRKYVERAKKKTELERKEAKEKSGVFTGVYAINPASGEQIPVWVADYVLMGYGTGAIMAVPAHDERDFEFATKYKLLIRQVIHPNSRGAATIPPRRWKAIDTSGLSGAYIGEGQIFNSDEWNGWLVPEQIGKVIDWLEKKGLGKRQVQYHLRDWSISRQRYWGTPIPVIYCVNCWENSQGKKLEVGREKLDNEAGSGKKSNLSHQSEVESDSTEANLVSNFSHPTSTALIDGKRYAIIPVPYDQLPVELPYDVDFSPKGMPPLATAEDWVKVKCPNCGEEARREVETMDTFVDSAWYFLGYLRKVKSHFSQENLLKASKSLFARKLAQSKQVKSENLPWDPEILKKWMPIDIYFGGAEHTLGHTLYSRFFVKFLHDLGVLDFSEYAKKRVNHGVILGPDGSRMSKSRGNVVNPDKEVKKYGADTIRLYLAFLGPYDLVAPWNPSGIKGVHNFLRRVWRLAIQYAVYSIPALPAGRQNTELSEESERVMHKTIKKVGEDIENNKFNTAIAALMTWLNFLESRVKSQGSRENKRLITCDSSLITREEMLTFLLLLAPFAPHMSEELYQQFFGNPKYETLNSKFESIHTQPWPKYDPKLVQDSKFTLVVQVNGKVRDKIEVQIGITAQEAEKMAVGTEKVKKYLAGKSFKKIFVPDRLINFVTSN